MAKVEEQKFHYAIGKPWDGANPNGSVGFYTYGSEIFYGTMNEAIEARDSFNAKAKSSFFFDADDKSRGGYRIYMVSEIPNSEHMGPVAMPEKKRVRTPKVPRPNLKDIAKAAADHQLEFYSNMMSEKKANEKKLQPKRHFTDKQIRDAVEKATASENKNTKKSPPKKKKT